MAHVYHWRHGWVPLDHEAALSKAKGDRAHAQRLMEAGRGSDTGIHSRKDVAKAVLDLPNVPNGPDRTMAKHETTMAAIEHDAVDLLPRSMAATARAVQTAQARHRRLDSQPVTARVAVHEGIYRGQAGHHITGSDARGRKVRVFVPGNKAAADHAAANIRAGRAAFGGVTR